MGAANQLFLCISSLKVPSPKNLRGGNLSLFRFQLYPRNAIHFRSYFLRNGGSWLFCDPHQHLRLCVPLMRKINWLLQNNKLAVVIWSFIKRRPQLLENTAMVLLNLNHCYFNTGRIGYIQISKSV